ncbi:MAG: DUF3108 domain-containing protein [Magnetococcales bacterium]|nr:DUF3108 domain-containing protein [Magnetococcales bacterium]
MQSIRILSLLVIGLVLGLPGFVGHSLAVAAPEETLLGEESLFSEGLISPEANAAARKTWPKLGAAPGEILRFNIHWIGVPGGKATMRLDAPKPDLFFITATLESIGVVKWFHPVEDLLKSSGIRLPDSWSAIHYIKKQLKDGRYRLTDHQFIREEEVVLRQLDKGRIERVQQVSAEANDPLTVVYALRAREDFKPGAKLKLPIMDGKKHYEALVSVGEAKDIATPLGWFQAYPAEIRVKYSDLFRHSGAITIWFTDDDRRLPIRVEANVKVGVAAADLTYYEDGRGGRGEIEEESE